MITFYVFAPEGKTAYDIKSIASSTARWNAPISIDDGGTVYFRAPQTRRLTKRLPGGDWEVIPMREDGNPFSVSPNGTIALTRDTVGGQVLFTLAGDVVTDIADSTKEGYSGFGVPAVNNSGTVAFRTRAEGFDTIVAGSGGELTRIAHETEVGTQFQGKLSINRGGTVAFVAGSYPSSTSLLKGSGGVPEVVTESSASLRHFSSPAINDDGDVAFFAQVESPHQAMLLARAGRIERIADTQGQFQQLGSIFINNSGTIMFSADLDGGPQRGIYTGPDLFWDKVVASGDLLDGRRLTSVGLADLNNRGQVVFNYESEGGLNGIAVASPVDKPGGASAVLVGTADSRSAAYGGLATIYGEELAPALATAGTVLPNQLSGTAVLFVKGARKRWLEARRAELLPVRYLHVVFTLPRVLSQLALQNKKLLYSLLLKASAQTLLGVARDPLP